MEAEKLRKELGKNARKTIEEKFSLEKVVNREMEIYKRLLQ
jgi:glycosyltransferase involved in cell wall biosynthesis